ncbi:MAG: hypothetical protein OHK0029_36520 [Armatimonadaceae bacterium]
MAKGTSSRRAARESALRILYTVDIGKQPVEDTFAEAQTAHNLDDATAGFAKRLVEGTLRNLTEIDTVLDRLATGFPTDRQTAVDRNILRLAASEILFSVSDAPPGAVVNEAVELAKKYSTNESGRFVNGVLGTLVRETTGSAALAEPTPETTDDAAGEDTNESGTSDGLPGDELLLLPPAAPESPDTNATPHGQTPDNTSATEKD